MGSSPYRTALGAEHANLHPTLQRYFDTIPDEHVGVGHGSFDVVGTPRRWLHPFLRLLDRRGVVPAGYWTNVPFTVTNSRHGDVATGVRVFHFPDRDWAMTDLARATPSGVTDTLGTPATVAATFTIDVRDGGLHMRSIRTGVRLGALRIPAPRWFSPVIEITESVDSKNQQRMRATITLPIFGLVYEYGGSFTYAIYPESEAPA